MFIVRFLALAALVVWLGSLIVISSGGAAEQLLQHLATIAYACGGTMLVCLTILKFVGPPPSAFPIRAALVAAMLIATAVSNARRLPLSATSVNTALGLVLLAWYARE